MGGPLVSDPGGGPNLRCGAPPTNFRHDQVGGGASGTPLAVTQEDCPISDAIIIFINITRKISF